MVGLRTDDPSEVTAALAKARARGCLTIDVTAGSGDGSPAEYPLGLGITDPLVARELHVTIYHLLWEVVQELMGGGAGVGGSAAPDGLGELYPFLYDRPPGDVGDANAQLVASTAAKGREIGRLRREVLATHRAELGLVGESVRRCAERGGTVWTFGNGGSSTDAQAIACLLRAARGWGSPVRARALTDDVATVTALANDVSFDVVFARMLASLARPGDVAVGLSTSGGSTNVLDGLERAVDLGLTTVGFAGYDGGPMGDLEGLSHLFAVPSSSVHRIQEAQTTLAHVLVELARDAR